MKEKKKLSRNELLVFISFMAVMIVTVSYVGNLLFLFFGGSFVDHADRKKEAAE